MMSTKNEGFDVIVLGGGAAGSVLAARLSEDSSRRVLLLEAGKRAPETVYMPAKWISHVDTEIDWKYHTVPQEGCFMRRLPWPRGKVIGGSGSINAMIYIRGVPSDFDGWEASGCRGWGWKNVLPIFKSSEHNGRFGNNDYHSSGGPLYVGDVPYVDPTEPVLLEAAKNAGHAFNEDFNGQQQEGVGYFQLLVKSGERFSAAKAFLEPAEERPNLEVRTGVMIKKLIIENNRASGVEYLHNGETHRISTSGDIVLSSGAIGSPQILMLSGIGPAAELKDIGVQPLIDLPGVGKNLQDHINIPITYRSKENVGLSGMAAAEVEEAVDEWRKDKTGIITSNWAALGGHVKSTPEVKDPDLQLYFIAATAQDLARYNPMHAGFNFYATLQRPKSSGEIKLRSADPLEHPAIDPKYFMNDETNSDIKTMIAGVKINRKIAEQSPIAEFIDCEVAPSAGAKTDQQIGDVIRSHCTTLYHPAGTCKMGVDEMSVVDPELKLNGIDNVRIADASIMPHMISGNLQATVIMTAERCSTFMRNH